MLMSGVVFERREKYRTFSYGLIGGGWAALYTTVYAMYAIPAAKVLDNPFARHHPAARRRRRHDRPLAQVPLADRHRARLLPRIRHARHRRSHHLQRADARPAGRFAALRGLAQPLEPLRDLRPDRHLCHLRPAQGHRVAALADAGTLPGLLADLRRLRPAARRPLAAPAQRPRLSGAFHRQMERTPPPTTSGSWPPAPPSSISPAPSCALAPDAGSPPCSSTPRSPPPPSCSSCRINGCRSPWPSKPNSTTSPACDSAPRSSATWQA